MLKNITFNKELAQKAILFAPLLLLPVFVGLVATAPEARKSPYDGYAVTYTLPPARPYVAPKEQVVQGQTVVRTETKIVYIEVPAKDGKPATVKPVEMHVPVEVPKPVPVPVEQPKPTELDRIFAEPPKALIVEKPAPRQVVTVPVTYNQRSMKNFQPKYPEALQAAGIEGTVRVRVTVGPNGQPRSIRLLGLANPVLFRAVRDHGMKVWRFNPAKVDGMPSTGTIDVALAFKITG